MSSLMDFLDPGEVPRADVGMRAKRGSPAPDRRKPKRASHVNPERKEKTMDKAVRNSWPTGCAMRGPSSLTRPSRQEAENAVRTLIQWAGDDPDREGLVGTPARVVRAYEDWFSGYSEDPKEFLSRTFEEVGVRRNRLVARYPVRIPLRASHRSNHRAHSHRISPA
jgi:hypothetical protein